jgi:hypothetical protein
VRTALLTTNQAGRKTGARKAANAPGVESLANRIKALLQTLAPDHSPYGA